MQVHIIILRRNQDNYFGSEDACILERFRWLQHMINKARIVCLDVWMLEFKAL